MKVSYNNIMFDSEQEVEYYKLLTTLKKEFYYQDQYKKKPIHINLGRRKTYTPDFVVYNHEEKKIKIIELKGYAKWSANEDNNIMDFMKNKVAYDQDFLIGWLIENNIYIYGYDVEYQRLKHLKTYGFVDYGWKNPNSLANQRKVKIQEQKENLKNQKESIKEMTRYINYNLSLKKLTKKQIEWKNNFEREWLENNDKNTN